MTTTTRKALEMAQAAFKSCYQTKDDVWFDAGNVFATREAAQAMADFQRRARGCL